MDRLQGQIARITLRAWRDQWRSTQALDARICASLDDAVRKVIAAGGRLSADDRTRLMARHPALRQALNASMAELRRSLVVQIEQGIKEARLRSAAAADKVVETLAAGDPVLAAILADGKDRIEARRSLRGFASRKMQGMDLSDRVWRTTQGMSMDMERAIEVALAEGVSAQQLSQRVRTLLKEPAKLYRRVRDAEGNLLLSQAAQKYHPGTGVYRSSYKNAMRLARTEVNMAYQEADCERWRSSWWVRGIRVSLSNNHTMLNSKGKPEKFEDICDELAGDYPKDFKFTGWHPQCRCYATAITCSYEEIREYYRRKRAGEDLTDYVAPGSIEEPPENFRRWVENNSERIEKATEMGTLPYFIKDNRSVVDEVMKGKDKQEEKDDAKQIEVKNSNKSKVETLVEKETSIDNNPFLPVSSLEEAVIRAKSYGIESVDFTTASVEEVNVILEVFHKASEEYGINLHKLWLVRDLHKTKEWSGQGGFYNWDKKLLAINLSGFTSSSFKEITSYADKIAKLENNKASLLRQIEQSEARLGRSKSSDKILKADIKNFKSRISDIEIKIQQYDKLAKAGYYELPFTVADSFKEIKKQMQARTWHEIGHHLDDRLGRPKFKEGNLISEYAKEMRTEEFAEWFSQYKMRGSKEVPNDLLTIFRKVEYDRYGERKWQKLYFDSESGGYNVAHSMHQFNNSKPKGVPKTGGEAEKWLGSQLAKQGKVVEFLPESGVNGKSGDMRFDGMVWDCKYIPLANTNTVRSYIKDARKADRVIFCWEEESRLEIVRSAIASEVGNFRKKNRLYELPDIYWADGKGKLHLLWKK